MTRLVDYFGDYNLECGGLFLWKYQPTDSWYNVVEVTPESDCGDYFDGAFMVSVGTAMIPTDPQQVAEYKNEISTWLDSEVTEVLLVREHIAYAGFDIDYTNNIKIGKIEKYDNPLMKDENDYLSYRANTKLKNIVKKLCGVHSKCVK